MLPLHAQAKTTRPSTVAHDFAFLVGEWRHVVARADRPYRGDPNADRAHGVGEPRLELHADSSSLANLDHDVSQGTISTILRENALEPAPERVKKTAWTEFLKTHWDVLAATDFFTVDVWIGHGLTRFAVLFIIELSTRRIEIAGMCRSPTPPG